MTLDAVFFRIFKILKGFERDFDGEFFFPLSLSFFFLSLFFPFLYSFLLTFAHHRPEP